MIAEAEATCRGRIRYNVETKLTPDEPDLTPAPIDFADALVAVLEEQGVAARTMVQSFDWRTLRRVREGAPDLETACLTTEEADGDTIQRGKPGASAWTGGLDVDDFDGSVLRLVQASGCRIWSPRQIDLTASDVAAAHAVGIRVIPWTVNEPADIATVLELGVDGIISDHPDRVRSALKSRGRPLPEPCTSRGEATLHPGDG